jgi:hypothetical protein
MWKHVFSACDWEFGTPHCAGDGSHVTVRDYEYTWRGATASQADRQPIPAVPGSITEMRSSRFA